MHLTFSYWWWMRVFEVNFMPIANWHKWKPVMCWYLYIYDFDFDAKQWKYVLYINNS